MQVPWSSNSPPSMAKKRKLWFVSLGADLQPHLSVPTLAITATHFWRDWPRQKQHITKPLCALTPWLHLGPLCAQSFQDSIETLLRNANLKFAKVAREPKVTSANTSPLKE